MFTRKNLRPHAERSAAKVDPASDRAISTTFWSELASNARERPAFSNGRGLRVARLLVVLVCLALVSTNAWLVFNARTEVIDNAVQANTNLARAVTERVEGLIAETDHILNGVLFELERADITPDALLRLQPALVRHVAELESIKGLFVYDAQGRWIASSEPVWDASINNADRPYFVHHQHNPSAAALIGAPLVSRSSGEWVVPVSRRINDPDGQFAGVVLATLRADYLRRLLERFNLGREGAITLRVPAGIAVRVPFIDPSAAKPMAPEALKAFVQPDGGGTADMRSTLDGVQRLVSYEHARNYPLLVIVARSKEEVLQSWRRASIQQTAWACFLCLVLALAGIYARIAMRRRREAEERLQETSDALALASARLAKLAKYDSLTRLPNRRYFDEHLARSFQLAQREKRPISIVMIDVDEFKKFNDAHGHVEGDDCLKRIAAALRGVINRPQDMVARYGGEEMVLLLPFTDEAGAFQLAQAARLAVFNLQIPHASSSIGVVSVSLGLASAVPRPEDSATALLKAADAALYKAKQGGRNQVCSAPHA